MKVHDLCLTQLAKKGCNKMRKLYRLHGDNIVECERIANLLIGYFNPVKVERSFSSLACINLSIDLFRMLRPGLRSESVELD